MIKRTGICIGNSLWINLSSLYLSKGKAKRKDKIAGSADGWKMYSPLVLHRL